jgi:hypothetical protein
MLTDGAAHGVRKALGPRGLKDVSMSHRFMMFIDGANLQGVSNTIELKFPSYGTLINHLFQESVSHWGRSFGRSPDPSTPARFVRAYFYGVGSMDEWNLTEAQALKTLRTLFERNSKVARLLITLAERQDRTAEHVSIEEHGWQLFLEETRRWYDSKVASFEGTKRFLYGLESDTDFIEINRDGHMKLDLLAHTAQEKGVDTGFSVAMSTLTKGYDVALLVSGDSDGIPAIRHVKREGRQVGLIDFYQDDSPEPRGPNLSKALRREVDFITSISDRQLLDANIAVRRQRSAAK